jgi:hypothetical protein
MAQSSEASELFRQLGENLHSRLLKGIPQPRAGICHRAAGFVDHPYPEQNPWFIPLYRDNAVLTPASLSRSAYRSPSSRKGSYPR